MHNYNTRSVTDGLEIFLDFANPKCYPGTGTTVTDLSNGRTTTGTIVTGNTSTAGSTSYMDYNSSSSLSFTGLNVDKYNFTVSWSGRSTGTPPSNYRMVYRTYCSGVAYYHTDMRQTSNPYHLTYVKDYNISSWATVEHLSSADWALYEWNCYDLVVSGTYFQCFRNGELIGTNIITGRDLTGYSTIDRFDVNLSGTTTPYEMQTMKFYNRPLYDTEIKQNFNAIRGRYGL